MRKQRSTRLFAAAALASLVITALVGNTASAHKIPRWVKHVQHWNGGISNGVRERAAQASGGLVIPQTLSQPVVKIGSPALDNVQMNGDSDPPLPQDEPSIAESLDDPMNAVAASNDYTGDGFWIGSTTDGGQTWASQWKDPKFSFDGGRCFASDPSVAYSLRDHAFYLSTLCYFSTTPASEIQVWKSVDGGETWSSSQQPALVVTNHATDGSIDASVFYDKELMAVDNTPGSPYFGRLYVTYTKFHMTGGSYARSDYCPVQAAYTDAIPTADPAASSWGHTAIVPDAPGAKGTGSSANQFSTPLVDDQGALDVAFVQEDCNTSIDHALYFARSDTGGASFGGIVRVDRPGWFSDNPNANDNLPGKGDVRFPNTPSFAYDAARGRLALIYQNNANRTVSGADISLQSSDDFGATWTAPRTIIVRSNGRAAPRDQFFPAIGVDPDGVWFAIWQDTRLDPANHLISTFQGESSNGGQTWTNHLISTASFDPRKSFFTCGCFIGDYNQIAVSSEVVLPAWTDGRDSPPKPAGDSNVWTNVEIRS
ncbi:MAG: exo-alpha-sialidase [Actinobacteria bacterium]|nr:MAG: exo-alpha-sialidase [Actinomycetota bacterium]